jgi:hypothetical protein
VHDVHDVEISARLDRAARQRGLPDTRLAAHYQRATKPITYRSDQTLDRRELMLAPDQRAIGRTVLHLHDGIMRLPRMHEQVNLDCGS